MLKLKKINSHAAIIAWCMYDWAIAAFSVIVITFIFATYFTTQVAENTIVGTYQWANAMAFAGMVVAFSSPLCGAIADYGGQHKRWLAVFTGICVVSTALLWFAYPSQDSVYYTLACVVFGAIGFEVALVFYNTFLPTIAPRKYLGRISGWGWGCGYLGGILALSIALYLFIQANWVIPSDQAAQIRICGPFVALWVAVFSLPLFYFVPNRVMQKRPFDQAIRLGWKELLKTVKKLPEEKNILLYLIAHMIYTDGLNTLFAFGGIYAAGTYGLSFKEVLIFGITINIAAGIGAMTLAWLDDYLGSKKTILISLAFLIVLGLPILFLHNKYLFWGTALLVCLFIGPVQSASRSLMVRLISKEKTTEMFGLYALSGKITAFIGPWLLGVFTLMFSSQRVGMATILVFLFVGALLLIPVKVDMLEQKA